jgi:hypothetical protein
VNNTYEEDKGMLEEWPRILSGPLGPRTRYAPRIPQLAGNQGAVDEGASRGGPPPGRNHEVLRGLP